MTRATFLAGTVLALGAAWGGLHAVRVQIGGVRPKVLADGDVYPVPPDDALARGAALYGRLGCAACHTQQLSPSDLAPEASRDWGGRRTVARDYLGAPAWLGTRRVGPDLANVGARRSDPAWHRAHLADPRSVVPESPMPSYAFLSPVDRAYLAIYLVSLRRDVPLPEAPSPAPQP